MRLEYFSHIEKVCSVVHDGRRGRRRENKGFSEASFCDLAAVVAAAGGRRLLPGSPVARRDPFNPPTSRGGQPMGERRAACPAAGRA